MSNNFTISEFIIDHSEPVDLAVVDKILKYHIPVIQGIRDVLLCPIWPSENSGYRSVSWEHSHGRSGNSQHCFRGKGAVDYTCDRSRLDELFTLLCKSDYMRICLYRTFVHCDYRGDEKKVFKCETGNQWVQVK